jgi:hypothetical protein
LLDKERVSVDRLLILPGLRHNESDRLDADAVEFVSNVGGELGIPTSAAGTASLSSTMFGCIATGPGIYVAA